MTQTGLQVGHTRIVIDFDEKTSEQISEAACQEGVTPEDFVTEAAREKLQAFLRSRLDTPKK